MTLTSTTSILASFATLKCLSDAKKYSNAYQILAEFISYIIETEQLYVFTSIVMKNRLKTSFGFDIPEAVIKTAMKNLPYVTKTNGTYSAIRGDNISYDSFERIKLTAEVANSSTIDLLSVFIKERKPEKEILPGELEQDLIAFLIDDQERSSGKYTNLIGEFILKNEHNTIIQNSLRAIQEGSILYIGLNHNINETGSLTKELTLFLGTEVIFSLIGYNGEIHKQLTQDFINLVQNANVNGRKIHLRYFAEVKREIDSFFSSAESIVDGKMTAFDTVAMSAIVNNCKTSSDVVVKRADFYHKLQYGFGIVKDDRDDYYSDEFKAYNLESIIYTDPQVQNSWRFISHINKLREGAVFTKNTEAEYLMITNTRSILSASKEQTEKDKSENALEIASDYAISTNTITNTLWYKLGNGFGGKNYPNNANAVLKARVVLAASVSYKVSEVYNEAKAQFKAGEISKEQLTARIVALRKKPMLPEELESDSIEDIMDFSADFLSRFEEEISSNKTALQEKESEIQRLEDQNNRQLMEKNQVIAQKNQLLQQSSEERDRMALELSKYREKEETVRVRKEKLKKVMKFGISIIWKLVVIVLLVKLALFLVDKLNSNIPLIACAVIDIFGLFFTAWVAVKKDFSKYFEKPRNYDNNK